MAHKYSISLFGGRVRCIFESYMSETNIYILPVRVRFLVTDTIIVRQFVVDDANVVH